MASPLTFVTGGTVQAGHGVYLKRTADDELLAACQAGEFAYILSSRQVGKSSLMMRTAERLAEQHGVRPSVVDLTAIGTQVTADQWYQGLLHVIATDLDLSTNLSAWWQAHSQLGVSHRFTLFLEEVVLREVPERIVLFVDEIDTTLSLAFTDDFFAAIRALYLKRAVRPDLHRLSFVLIGVATPGDLIKDPERTPFNIGRRVEIADFTFEEAKPLLGFLPLPAPQGEALLERALHWTGGHPYLTLRVFREWTPDLTTPDDIDRLVATLFFGERSWQDSNLAFVRDMLTKGEADHNPVLLTYRAIRRGKPVRDEEVSQPKTRLKLSGLVKPAENLLRVRNRIYEAVFTSGWVTRHLRVNWRQRLFYAAAVLILLLIPLSLGLAYFAWRKWVQAEARGLAARSALLQNASPGQIRQAVLLSAESLRRYPGIEGNESIQGLLPLLRAAEATLLSQGQVRAVRFTQSGWLAGCAPGGEEHRSRPRSRQRARGGPLGACGPGALGGLQPRRPAARLRR